MIIQETDIKEVKWIIIIQHQFLLLFMISDWTWIVKELFSSFPWFFERWTLSLATKLIDKEYFTYYQGPSSKCNKFMIALSNFATPPLWCMFASFSTTIYFMKTLLSDRCVKACCRSLLPTDLDVVEDDMELWRSRSILGSIPSTGGGWRLAGSSLHSSPTPMQCMPR